MDFARRLNGLFIHMGFSNVKVARHGELDTSVISRFRTGKRVPSANGNQLGKLCRGAILLARERGDIEKLCGYCKIAYAESDDTLIHKLMVWMTDDVMLETRSKNTTGATKSQNKPLRAFWIKLDALMNTFNVSNIRLARALHIDTSMISRFRTGMRVPQTGSWVPNEICAWFVKRALALPHTELRVKLTKLLGEEPPLEPDALTARLMDWFLSEPADSGQSMTVSLLERIDAFRKSEPLPSEVLGQLNRMEPAKKGTSVFFGNEGLQEAVRQFLSLAAVQPKPCTLHLYSDQNMNWLSDNEEFALQWATLMAINLNSGNKIQIIHNIDRSLPEMFDAIKKWLPLYMTGLIEPFYVPIMGEKRFSRTMFILPGKAAISSFFVTGTEDVAEHLLTTVAARVENEENQFQALMATALPLIRIYPINDLHSLLSCFDSVISTASENILLTPSLSLATMPREVLESIIKRYEMTPEQSRGLLTLWKYEVSWLEKLAVTGLRELAAMPNYEELFSGMVPVAAPAQLCGRILYYNSTEYASHVENIRNLLVRYPNYNFFPLPISPFENIHLLINGNGPVLVVKSDEPSTAFVFEHPVMCRSFLRSLDFICLNSSQDGWNRNNVDRFLEKYME